MSLLQVDSLSIEYDGDAVVESLSFAIEPGESLGMVGESGSGKTQTALAILGLLPRNARTSGSICCDDTELLGANASTLDKFRAQRISMVFQDPALALNPYLRIGDQIALILTQHGLCDAGAAKRRVAEMLRAVGLPDPERQARAYPHQLSGGMRQRAMIASALIAEPDLLIADEPTTALDVTVQAQILDLLDELRKDTALLLITHDLGVVAGHCERMLVMEKGRLVETGATRTLFAAPTQQHTKAMIAAAPRLSREDFPAPVTSDVVLDVSAAAVRYREGRRRDLHAVRDVDLQLRAGETLAIVGESGSGKTSLVRAVLGLIPWHTGTVSYMGETLPRDARRRAAASRRDLQLVFQDPVGSLNPQMRVQDIVGEPLRVHPQSLNRARKNGNQTEVVASRRETRQKISDSVIAILDRVGLNEGFLRRFPHELSGGQAQRVALARALILKPRILVCDEAVAALDGTVREQVLDLLREIQRATGMSILFISHDLAVVRAISHRVLVMYLGRLLEISDNDALFKHARHPYTRALIAAVPAPDPDAPGHHATLSGEVPSILSPPSGCAFHPRCSHAVELCGQRRPATEAFGSTTVACHRATEFGQD